MRQRITDVIAIAGVFLAYAVTLRLALHIDYAHCLLNGAANTVPVVIFGGMARRLILRHLLTKPLGMQLAAHLVLGAAFVVLSYLLLIVLLGVVDGGGPNGFLVKPFNARATAWQSFENATIYALIAALSHLQGQQRMLEASRKASGETGPGSNDVMQASTGVTPVKALAEKPRQSPSPGMAVPDAVATGKPSRADPGPSRYFVRIGDELRPLDLDTVVTISGADDFSEVRTASATHLVRVTLAEFSRSLDRDKYVRVHRSWIVNVQHIDRAESAGGGRLLLHMLTGQTISTSRTGARLLRERVI